MSLIRQFVSVGGATLASRLLGFVRETMIANALGAGPVADAFYAAFRFPNLFRRLFAEGAFNAAFIPLFARTLEGEGEEAARKFAEDVLAALLLVLVALTAIVMIATPLIVTLIAPGFAANAGKVRPDRRAFPDHVPLSDLHVADGDGHRRAQRLPKLLRRGDRAAPPQRHRSIGARCSGSALALDTESVGRLLSWSIPVAGVAQLLWVVMAARRIGFTARFRRPRLTPGVKRLLWLAAPAAAAGGITQINLFVGQIIASGKGGRDRRSCNTPTASTSFRSAWSGIAIGVVLLPELSRALKANYQREAKHNQNRALEFALFLTLPAATALAIISDVVVRVLYERGAFTPETTEIDGTRARRLRARASRLRHDQGFHARLFRARGHEDADALRRHLGGGERRAGADALSAHPRGGNCHGGIRSPAGSTPRCSSSPSDAAATFRSTQTSRRNLPRILLCCAIMAAALFGGIHVLRPYFQPEAGILYQVGALLLLMGGGGIVYFVAAELTGAMSMRALLANLRRKPAALNLCCAVTVSLTLDVPAQESRRGPTRRRLKGWRRFVIRSQSSDSDQDHRACFPIKLRGDHGARLSRWHRAKHHDPGGASPEPDRLREDRAARARTTPRAT